MMTQRLFSNLSHLRESEHFFVSEIVTIEFRIVPFILAIAPMLSLTLSIIELAFTILGSQKLIATDSVNGFP